MKSSGNIRVCISDPVYDLAKQRLRKNIKKILTGLFVLFLLSLNVAAQDDTKHDPLLDPKTGGYPVFANSVEIVSVFDKFDTDSNKVLTQRIFDLDPDKQIAESTPFTPGSGNFVLINDLSSDCIAGDFDGDGTDEILTGWIMPGNILHLEMSSATRQKPTQHWQWDQRALFSDSWKCNGPIRLLAVNLDSTFRKEIVVCTPISSSLRVVTYCMDDTGQNLIQGDPVLIRTGPLYDIAAGDFNGDGRDELVHICTDNSGPNAPYMTLARYDYKPSEQKYRLFSSLGRPVTTGHWAAWKRLKVTTGNFRNLNHDEAVVSYTLTSGNSGRQVFIYVTLVGGHLRFALNFPGASPSGWTWGNGWESDAVAADLNPGNKDGEELIVAGPGEVAVLKFNSSLIPYYYGDGKARLPFLNPGTVENYERRRFLAVEDMDADTSGAPWIKEIIVAEHLQDSTTVIRVLSPNINSSDDITGLSQKSVYASPIKSCRSEIAVGDFDGDAIRLGPPTLITKQSVYQPIVELNVPPTHFDYLKNQIYDICNVHGTTPSEFKVTYTETNSQTSYFSSELKQGWGVSSEISGGGSIFGVTVKAYVKASYDRGYYGSHSQSSTVTASQVTSSIGDNWILATVTDYDFWEYPLYAMGNHFGNILVQVPHLQGTEWFPGRNVIARDWMMNHEVGNLFSYLRKDDIAAWTGAKLLTNFTGKYISIASSGSWTLDLASQTIDSKKLTSSIGTEVGSSVSGWGIEAKVSAKYSREEITTHTSTASKDVLIEVKVSDTDKAFGDTDYLVTPFIYWGRNGALVVDYAVDPSSSGDPVYGTFWDKNYLSHSDPGFILPWRYDTLKGIGGTEDLKLYCKSLHISPIAPAAGDTAHITANIHNFSLKNTTGTVTVRFYLGDPADGGTPIQGTGGLVDLSTTGFIPAQNRTTVNMDWVVPSGLSSRETIYAVIDPDNAITEIHEDNNIGFIPLTVQGATGIEEEHMSQLPDHFDLRQNYPNPFNPVTTITYQLPERCYVRLAIFDLLGREVATLVNDIQDPGHKSLIFDATGLASGIYFYRLQAGSFTAVRKFLLLR